MSATRLVAAAAPATRLVAAAAPATHFIYWNSCAVAEGNAATATATPASSSWRTSKRIGRKHGGIKMLREGEFECRSGVG